MTDHDEVSWFDGSVADLSSMTSLVESDFF